MKWTELVQGAEMAKEAKEAQWAKGLKKMEGFKILNPSIFFQEI